MKKYSTPIIILLVFLSTFYLTDCERVKKGIPGPAGLIDDVDSGARAHLIELQVNTADPNKLDSTKKWRFIGQGPNEPDSLFTTLVRPGDRVIWVGVSSSSIEDKVEITKIKHIRGKQVLTKKTLTGKDGVVVGDIVHDADTGAVGKYELKFKVTNKLLEASDTITVDPKLRIHDD